MRFGPDVELRCRSASIGPGVSIGVKTSENFRSVAGVCIECDELELGAGCVIDRSVLLSGGVLRFGDGCRVGAGSTFRVKERADFGDRCMFGADNTVEGRRVAIGRELWTGPEVRVGGGSCFEAQSELEVGYWCHLGMRVFINTARKVTIGNEVGIGTGSAVFTHGAYQSALAGYPVSFAPVDIGDNCWLPGAVVNPGVSIGPNSVIGVGSVVTRSIPAGCLAAGVPCRVVRENAFPRAIPAREREAFIARFLADAAAVLVDCGPEYEVSYVSEPPALVVRTSKGKTKFLLSTRRIVGPAGRLTERLRDLLRRHGIRFFSEVFAGEYRDWHLSSDLRTANGEDRMNGGEDECHPS